MKKHTPLLPQELQKEQLILSTESTADEKLTVIEHYLPRTRNLAENLSMLRHLGIDDRDISGILSGGCLICVVGCHNESDSLTVSDV